MAAARAVTRLIAPLRRWASEFSPDQGVPRKLAALTLVQALGSGAFLTASVPLLVVVVGLSPSTIGWGLSLAGACGFLVSIPAGRSADRWGGRWLLVGLYGLLGLVFACYGFVYDFLSFFLVAILVAGCEAAISPIRSALVYALCAGDSAPIVRAQMRSFFNIGFVVGAAGAGAALWVGDRSALIAVGLASCMAHLCCMVVSSSLPADGRRISARTRFGKTKQAMRNGPFIVLTIVNGLLELHSSVLSVAVPLWIVTSTAAPSSVISILVALNAVIVIVFQVRVGRSARTVADGARLQRLAGVILALSALAFCVGGEPDSRLGAIAFLFLGIVLLSVGEMTQTAGGYTLSFELPPEGKQGEYQGVFSMGRNLRQSLGPGLVASALSHFGGAGWLAIAVGFFFLGLAAGPIARAADQAIRKATISGN